MGRAAIEMVVVDRSFAAEYAQLEETFRRLADEDRTVYLPNPRPRAPVDFFFIAMEPSLGAKSAEARRVRVSQGLKNFLSTVDDFSLHYAIRKFLCGRDATYHLTDLSKGSMSIQQARMDRWRRWDRWHPSLVQEFELVAKPGAKIVAIGKKVEAFLERKRSPRPDVTILHYAATAVPHRRRAIEGRKAEYSRFAAAVTLTDIVKVAEAALAEAETSRELRQHILDGLRRRHALTQSQKQLLFTYKVDFEMLKTSSNRCHAEADKHA